MHDEGGLYLRRRASGCHWYLRLTDPRTGANPWHRMFQEDPRGAYPHKSLAEARDEAERLWTIRRHGIDLRVQREQMLREQQPKFDSLTLRAAPDSNPDKHLDVF